MILYGSMLSPYVRKVAIAARELGLDLEVKLRAPHDPDPEFCATSPLGKIPGFSDGDFTLSDSTAICVYLDALAEGGGLIPAEPRARAKTIWWDEFVDNELSACGVVMFFNRIVGPLFMNLAGDAAAADRAERETLPRLMAIVEAEMPADGFLVGNTLTLADVALASLFVNLRHLDLAPDPAAYPRTAAYVARTHARAPFAETIARETAAIAKARAKKAA